MLRFVRSREIKTASCVLFNNAGRFASTKAGGRLDGKVAIITGAARGLGKATAQEFIQHGARVVLSDINSKLGLQAAKEMGLQAHFIPCDVTDEAQVAQLVNDTVAHHGKLDIMHNNAAVQGPIPPSIADLDLDQFDDTMRVNVRAVLCGIKHAARVMIPAGSGSILCMSSIAGVLGGIGPHPYSISKFAVIGLVKSVAAELRPHGIRVNCISPSGIPTAMAMEFLDEIGLRSDTYSDQVRQRLVANCAEGIKGVTCEEGDVAKAAAYLASDEAKYVTGHNLVVDGGYTSCKNLTLPSPDHFA